MEDDGQDEVEGPCWLPLPEDVGEAPRWWDGRAIVGVYRDFLPMGLGSILGREDPRLALAQVHAGWNPDPEAESDEDLMQAIGAKAHLAWRSFAVFVGAQLVQVEPVQARCIPDWDDAGQAASGFAATVRLPVSPVFFDFESAAGHPTSWTVESWTQPFHLRGALMWQTDEALCVLPFGSVAGMQPWGGTDYQAWARFMFWRDAEKQPPLLGPGDNVVVGDDVFSWVRFGESICSHQAAIGYHLTCKALRLLWAITTFDLDVSPRQLPRAERRRAVRAGQTVGLSIPGLPSLAPSPTADGEADTGWEALTGECPFPSSHARLIEAHAHWHAALGAYHDPGQFMVALNAAIQAMRNVTFVMQQELSTRPDLTEWYEEWRQRFIADPMMRWAVGARNQVVHASDLAAHSTARAWIGGERVQSEISERPVAPTATAAEVARQIKLGDVDRVAQKEGVLVVERRWVVAEFPEDELLDVLAHNFAELTALVEEAHSKRGADFGICEKAVDDPCGGVKVNASGRISCMSVAKALRTSRRNLMDGAPINIAVATMRKRPLDESKLRTRYPTIDFDAGPTNSLFEEAALRHDMGRAMMETDGEHVTITWLFHDGELVDQMVIVAHDQRELFLAIERLATEAGTRGANQIILSAEGWEADALSPEDPRATLRAEAREDRREVFTTCAMQRGGPNQTWRTPVERDGADRVVLGEVTTQIGVPLRFAPVIEEWESWSKDPLDEDGARWKPSKDTGPPSSPGDPSPGHRPAGTD